MSVYCHIVRFIVPTPSGSDPGLFPQDSLARLTKQCCCFSGLFFCIIHSFVTAHTLQESDSQGIYNELCTRKVS